MESKNTETQKPRITEKPAFSAMFLLSSKNTEKHRHKELTGYMKRLHRREVFVLFYSTHTKSSYTHGSPEPYTKFTIFFWVSGFLLFGFRDPPLTPPGNKKQKRNSQKNRGSFRSEKVHIFDFFGMCFWVSVFFDSIH